MTNMTGLLIACFVVIFTNINAFRSFTKKELFKEREVWRKTLLVKIIVTLVTQGLLVYFPFLYSLLNMTAEKTRLVCD